MPHLRKLGFQGWNGRRGLGCLRSNRDDVEAPDTAELKLPLHAAHRFLLSGERLPRGLDLRAQRCLADRRSHDVAGKRQARALELIALVIDERLQALELASVATEDIERVGNVDRRV